MAGHRERRRVNQGDRGGSAVAVVPGAQAAGPRQGNRALSQLTRTVCRMPPLCGTVKSGSNRPPILGETGRAFWFKSATHSG